MTQICNRCYKVVETACQSDTESRDCRHLLRMARDAEEAEAAGERARGYAEDNALEQSPETGFFPGQYER